MVSRYFGAGEPPKPDSGSVDAAAASPDQRGASEATAAISATAGGSLDPGALAQRSGGAGEPRLALLIGNDNYAHSKLANPVRDVREIGETLKALGFNVTLVENADKPTLHSAVIDFGSRLDAAGPEAVAMLYYAGHGIQHEGTNYLIPLKAEIPTSRHLAVGALKVDEIVAELSRAPRKANVIVLDACRVDPIPTMASSSRDVTQGLAALKLPTDGWLVAYSTMAGAVAADGDGPISPYAEALIRTLPSLLEPGRRVHDVFVETAEIVRLATGGRQQPALYIQGSLPALVVTDKDRQRLKELQDALARESDSAQLQRIIWRMLAPRRRLQRGRALTTQFAGWIATAAPKAGPPIVQMIKAAFILFFLWYWLKGSFK